MNNILTYCQAAEPLEACGFILADGSFWPCPNVAEAQDQSFRIGPEQWQLCGQTVSAIVHSHPQGEPYLSGADRQMQVASKLDWWLVVEGQIKTFKPVPHLRGRPFDYGVYDCYTILEDAYHLASIDLMPYVRQGVEAESQQQAFLINLPKSGFYQTQDLQVGDVILVSSGGIANHAALYIGDNQVLHHAYGFLSRIEHLNGHWLKRIHGYWRHQAWSPSSFTAICADLAHSMSFK